MLRLSYINILYWLSPDTISYSPVHLFLLFLSFFCLVDGVSRSPASDFLFFFFLSGVAELTSNSLLLLVADDSPLVDFSILATRSLKSSCLIMDPNGSRHGLSPWTCGTFVYAVIYTKTRNTTHTSSWVLIHKVALVTRCISPLVLSLCLHPPQHTSQLI